MVCLRPKILMHLLPKSSPHLGERTTVLKWLRKKMHENLRLKTNHKILAFSGRCSNLRAMKVEVSMVGNIYLCSNSYAINSEDKRQSDHCGWVQMAYSMHPASRIQRRKWSLPLASYKAELTAIDLFSTNWVLFSCLLSSEKIIFNRVS